MTDIAALKALKARVDAAEGPDRELDLEILACVGQCGQWSEADIQYAMLDIEGTTKPPAFTSSIDAAVALVEGVLPGWKWSAGFSRHVPHNAQLWPPSETGYFEGEVDSNRSLAILSALLAALIARGEANAE